MATRQDPYAALRVTPDADDEVIKAAYRALMLKYHPDRHPNGPGEEAEAKKINEAYALLSEPSRRRRYDEDQDDHRFERASEGLGANSARQQDLWRFTDEVGAADREDRSRKTRVSKSGGLRRFGFRAFGGLSLLASAALVGFVYFHNGLQNGLGLRGAKPFALGGLAQLKQFSAENLLAGVENAIGGGAGPAADGPKLIRIKPAPSGEPAVKIFRGEEGLSSAVQAGYSEEAFGNGRIYARSEHADLFGWLRTWARKTFAVSERSKKSRGGTSSPLSTP